MFELLDTGAADVGVVNRIFGAMEEHRYGVERTPIVFNPSQLHFVFPKGSSRSAHLRDAIDRHVRAQKDVPGSVLQQSITYFLSGAVDMRSSVTPLERLRRRVDLDSDEQARLKAHPRIRVGVDPEFAPFEIVTEDGRYLGAAADYVRLVGRILGVSMEPVTGIPRVEAVERARNREIDVLPAVGISDERRQFLDYSQPYLEFPRVVVTRSDSAVRGLDDLAGVRLAVQRDSSHAGFVREMTDLEATYFDTFEQALLSLSRGEVDAVLGNLAVSTHWIRELSLTNLKIAAHVSDTTFPLAFAVRKDWPELRGLIDKALGALSPQDHADIKRRWLPVEVPEPRLADQVTSRLTAAERQWLEEHTRVRVGVPSNDPPLQFPHRVGRVSRGDPGLSRPDRRRRRRSFRCRVRIRRRIRAGPPRGGRDRPCRYPRYDAENARGIHYTQIFVPTPLVVITRDREESISGPADLASRRVALILDHPDSDRVLAEHPDIEPVMVDGPLGALRAVATGAVDAHVGVLGTSIYRPRSTASSISRSPPDTRCNWQGSVSRCGPIGRNLPALSTSRSTPLPRRSTTPSIASGCR
ncbi:MAG: transporter substrate-binding domain-containing protein [Gammaproteobacteria bacterium]|nr:transporter substrate-binding domain-containing protein [Gammaproteobacteria bacterium]